MKRKIFINQELNQDKILQIKDQEIINRINNVYRLKLNDGLIFIGNNLLEGYYYLTKKDKNSLIFKAKYLKKRKLMPLKEVFLYLSFLKKEKFEFILGKVFELGIKKIIPLKTERISWSTAKVSDRWRKIIYQGIEIADWNYLPEITNPINLNELPENTYVLDKYGEDIRNINFNYKIEIVLGPEGGFSEKELKILSSKKCKFVSLSKSNLRAETALMIAIGIINFYKN
ncbi:MAG: ribosomal RNA small subunit methyltransferase E [Candidatus Parcubacteria bacterium]|nr:MAG: ribosomal RNA small subunit methyltransferase E [Candidatus Parcubacteria bacterium]